MDKKMKTVRLDQETIAFLEEHGIVETAYGVIKYGFPYRLRLLELNEFEVIEKDPMRYFFVSFSGLHPETDKDHLGHVAFDCPNFPPMYMITEYIIPEILKIKYKNVVMMNLIEIKSREDFEQFIDGGGIDYQLKDILGE